LEKKKFDEYFKGISIAEARQYNPNTRKGE
jgi:hypothetical protein